MVRDLLGREIVPGDVLVIPNRYQLQIVVVEKIRPNGRIESWTVQAHTPYFLVSQKLLSSDYIKYPLDQLLANIPLE